MASAKNNEITNSKKKPNKRSQSSWIRIVPKKPSHSNTIARGTQRGIASLVDGVCGTSFRVLNRLVRHGALGDGTMKG